MKFTIDRSKWRCGGDYSPGYNPDAARGLGETLLRNQEGFMCCLGHIACQLGVSIEAISDMGCPDDVDELQGTILTKPGSCCWVDSQLSIEAIGINDRARTNDEDRERDLAELFAKHGHELTFTGEYVKPAA